MKAQLPILLFLSCLAAGAQPSGSLLELKKTIPLDNVAGRIDHMAVDVSGQRLFVSALGNDTVEVVDLAHGKRTQSLGGFAEPQGIVYVPEFGQLFVANGSDGTCRILNGHTFKTISSVQLGDDADNVRYDEKSKRVYVGYGSGALAAIDAKTGQKMADIPLSGHPESFRLARGMIFVNVPEARQIALVDAKTETVPTTWPLTQDRANFPMFLDEADNRLFIGCRDPARLLVYNATSGQVVASVSISQDTDDLFYDADRKLIYISCGEGDIVVVRQTDADHYAKVEALPTAAGARTSLFVPELKIFCLAVPHRGNQEAEIRVYRTP